jgi:cytochrome c553
MRRFLALTVVVALPFAAAVAVRAAMTQPDWAYAIAPPAPPGAPAAPVDTTKHSLAGTPLQFTRAEIGSRSSPADWYPNEHPPEPDVVAHAPNNMVRACALCHYPNGKGRPENASVSGLPAAYVMQQLNDFRDGKRKSAEPKKANVLLMIGIAKSLTPEEMQQATGYFSSIKFTPWIRVIETNTVPKVESHGGIWVPIEGPGAGKEPIGTRVVEVPENAEHTEALKDPHSGFIAYVPVGSLKKGEALVKTGGNGKTTACGVCHGADLLGLGPVPAIAGRSASYLARQLSDMQVGARNGEWTPLMKPVVEKLTNEDLVDIVAYVSSRPVSGSANVTK